MEGVTQALVRGGAWAWGVAGGSQVKYVTAKAKHKTVMMAWEEVLWLAQARALVCLKKKRTKPKDPIGSLLSPLQHSEQCCIVLCHFNFHFAEMIHMKVWNLG